MYLDGKYSKLFKPMTWI